MSEPSHMEVALSDVPAEVAVDATLRAVRRRRRLRRWVWGLGIVGVTLSGLVGGGAYLARTEVVAGRVVDEAVARLEQRLGMHIEHGAIEPVGWTGIEVRDVTISWDAKGGEPWAKVRAVRAYPDLGEALTGDLRLADMELEGVSAALEVDQEDSDLQRLKAALLGEGARGDARGEVGAERAFAPSVVRLRGATLHLKDKQQRVPDVHMESQVLDVDASGLRQTGRIGLTGDVVVKGLGAGQIEGEFDLASDAVRLGVTLVESTDLSGFVRHAGLAEVLTRAKVQARGVEVAWPLAVTLRDAHLSELGQPWLWPIGQGAASHTPRLDAIDVQELSVALQAQGPRIGARGAILAIKDGDQLLQIPLGDVQVELGEARGDVTVDLNRRIGADGATVHLEWDTSSEQLRGDARMTRFDVAPYARLMPSAALTQLGVEGGRLSGFINIDALLAERILDLDVDVTLEEGTVLAPALASGRMEQANVGLKGKLQIRRDPVRVQLDGGQVRLGLLDARLDASLEAVDGGLIVKLDLRSPELHADHLVSSLPRGFAPALEGYRFEGTYGFRLALEVDTRSPDALVLEGDLDLAQARVVAWGGAADVQKLKGDFMMHPSALPQEILVGPLTDHWVPWEQIPEVLVQALVSAEDGRFFEHDGFDPRGIRAALIENIRQQRFARGGSTISQQVIKNLFLSHERTLGRKFQEAVLTWVMEQTLPKERILTLYLNMLHLGPGIYGIREAARRLFDKHPDRLSLRESVFLSCILPNPNYFVRLYAQGIVPEDRRVKMRNILRNMHNAGLLGPKTFSRHARLSDDGIVSIAPPPSRLVNAEPALPDEEPAEGSGLGELMPVFTAN